MSVTEKIALPVGFTEGQRQKNLETAKQKCEQAGWAIKEYFNGGLGKTSYLVIEKDKLTPREKPPKFKRPIWQIAGFFIFAWIAIGFIYQMMTASAIPANLKSEVKPYSVFHRGDFGFNGRNRLEWWITAPEATTYEQRAVTAMQAAIDLQKESKAQVASIWLEVDPESVAKNKQLAVVLYSPDGGGLSGDDKWSWKVEAAGADGSRKNFPVK